MDHYDWSIHLIKLTKKGRYHSDSDFSGNCTFKEVELLNSLEVALNWPAVNSPSKCTIRWPPTGFLREVLGMFAAGY